MFPKDAVKAVKGGLEVKMINVISPLSIDEGIPESGVENLVNFIVDGKDLDPELKKQISFTIEDQTFTVAKAKEFEGVVIPVGGHVRAFLPATGYNAGEEHEFELIIQTDNPFQLKFKRIIV
jgi:hypothetical protein